MKALRRILAIVLSAVLLVAVMPFTLACDGDNGGGEGGSDKTEYTVTVQRSGGYALKDVTVVAYTDTVDPADRERVAYGVTDADGVFKFSAPKATYSLEFGGNLPTGYPGKGGYRISGDKPEATFKLSASVISEPAAADYRYSIGSVMHDFSFTDTQGRAGSLSGVLKTKKAVLLNFWYTTCTYCVYEFPALKTAYEQYANDVEVLAITVHPNDTRTEVENFRTDVFGQFDWDVLPFTFISNEQPCSASTITNFGVNEFPTSVLVDREGVVCFKTSGAGTEKEFTSLFAYYSADNYVQKIYFPEESGNEKPDVDFPGSAAIAAAASNTGSGFDGVYTSPENEYNWPWTVSEGGDSIQPSNTGHNTSFSMLDISVTASQDQVIAFDYKVSSEENYDQFLVFAENVLIATYSGIGGDWKTCYAYVPVKATGKYTVSLAYTKDEARADGDDTVYVKNIRFVAKSDIAERTELTYRAATGGFTDTDRYNEYITPVLGDDGYYRVGSKTGPMLLANLMEATAWSNESAWSYVMNGNLAVTNNAGQVIADYTEEFTRFAQISNNSARYGFLGVTPAVMDNLKALTSKFGSGHTKEWLELCSYVIVYGGEEGEVLGDPAIGLSDYSAIPAVLVDNASALTPVNHVDKRAVLMPRGMWYQFTPEETAVYRVRSIGKIDSYGWIVDDTLRYIAESDDTDPEQSDLPADELGNFCINIMLEQGRTYYILADYNRVDQLGKFDFVIEKLAASGEVWTHASAGDYQQILDKDGNVTGVELRGAVNAVLGDDGNYHVGSKTGPLLYINMTGATYMFGTQSLEQFVSWKRYYCRSCATIYHDSTEAFEREQDPQCWLCGMTGKNNFCEQPIPVYMLPEPQRLNGEGEVLCFTFHYEDGSETKVPMYALDAPAGAPLDPANYPNNLYRFGLVLHDYTDAMRGYIADSKDATKYPSNANEIAGVGTSHSGYVVASEELVEILKKFIVFGDFAVDYSVDNAWLLLASYYKHF